MREIREHRVREQGFAHGGPALSIRDRRHLNRFEKLPDFGLGHRQEQKIKDWLAPSCASGVC